MDFEFESLDAEVLTSSRLELYTQLQDAVIDQDDKLVLKQILLDVLTITHGMEDNLIIMKELHEVSSNEVDVKKLVMNTAREQILSMYRVYKLGKTWLMNSLLDISLLLRPPTPTIDIFVTHDSNPPSPQDARPPTIDIFVNDEPEELKEQIEDVEIIDAIGVLEDNIVCTDISEDIKIDVEDVLNCDVKPGDELTKSTGTRAEITDVTSLSKKLGITVQKVKSEDPYPCPLCKFQATSKFGLRKHKASEHKRILQQCAQCGYSAQNLKELRIHVKDNAACRTNPVNKQKVVRSMKKKMKPKDQTDSASENSKYLCDQCEFTTRLPTYLKLHMQTAHENVRYPCNLCDYKATRTWYLKTHINSVHKGILFECDQCEYKGNSLHVLKTHKKRRHGVKLFQCDACEFGCSVLIELKRHKESKHEGITYPCTQCDYVGAWRHCLIRHVRKFHENLVYPCKHCDYTSTCSSTFKIHVETKHLGIRYSCGICESNFASKSARNSHRKKKHSAKI